MQTIMKGMKRMGMQRIMAWMLVLCMVFSLMPATVWAELIPEDETVVTEGEVMDLEEAAEESVQDEITEIAEPAEVTEAEQEITEPADTTEVIEEEVEETVEEAASEADDTADSMELQQADQIVADPVTGDQIKPAAGHIMMVGPDTHDDASNSVANEILDAGDNVYGEVYICFDQDNEVWYNLSCFEKKSDGSYNLMNRVYNNAGVAETTPVPYTKDDINNARIRVLSESWNTCGIRWQVIEKDGGNNDRVVRLGEHDDQNDKNEVQGYAGCFANLLSKNPADKQFLVDEHNAVSTELHILADEDVPAEINRIRDEHNNRIFDSFYSIFRDDTLRDFGQNIDRLSDAAKNNLLNELDNGNHELERNIRERAEVETMKTAGYKRTRETEFNLKDFAGDCKTATKESTQFNAENHGLVIRMNAHNIGWINGEYANLASANQQDQIIRNGRVEFISCEYEDGSNNSGFDGEGYRAEQRNGVTFGGTVWFKAGSVLTLRLVPDYGYQFKSATVNGGIVLPSEEENIFRIQLPNGTYHLGVEFEKTDNEAVTDAAAQSAVGTVSDLGIQNSGGIKGSLSVHAKKATPSEAETSGMRGAIATGNDLIDGAVLDLDVSSYTQKGATDGRWERPITDLGSSNNVNISIRVSDAVAAAIGNGACSVVRAHTAGGRTVYTELPATYDSATKMLTFSSNQFSTFAIAAQPVKQAGTELNDTATNATVKVTNPGRMENGVVVGAEVEYVKPAGSKTKVTIPSKVTDESGIVYTVTGVAKNAFKGNKKVKTVTVPNTVTTIGDNAFSKCKKLTSVTVGKSIKSIGKSAFSGSKNIKKITIKAKKMPKIGKNAFKGIQSDATIKVPKKLYEKFKKKLTAKTGFLETMNLIAY